MCVMDVIKFSIFFKKDIFYSNYMHSRETIGIINSYYTRSKGNDGGVSSSNLTAVKPNTSHRHLRYHNCAGLGISRSHLTDRSCHEGVSMREGAPADRPLEIKFNGVN